VLCCNKVRVPVLSILSDMSPGNGQFCLSQPYQVRAQRRSQSSLRSFSTSLPLFISPSGKGSCPLEKELVTLIVHPISIHAPHILKVSIYTAADINVEGLAYCIKLQTNACHFITFNFNIFDFNDLTANRLRVWLCIHRLLSIPWSLLLPMRPIHRLCWHRQYKSDHLKSVFTDQSIGLLIW